MAKNKSDKPDKPLDARQLQAVRLLASGLTQKEVGERVGVTTRTIERWNTAQIFRDSVNALIGTVPIAKAKSRSKNIIAPIASATPIKLLPGEPLTHPSELISNALETLRECLQGDHRMGDKLRAVQLIFEASGIKPLPQSPKPEQIASQEDVVLLLSQMMQDATMPEQTRLSAAQNLAKIHGLYGDFNESLACLRQKYGISIWNDGENWHIAKAEL
jgi:transcriptional regulator with XRE-family HTH domain